MEPGERDPRSEAVSGNQPMISQTRTRPASMRAPQLRRDFWGEFKREMERTSTIGCSRASSDGWMWHSASLSAGYLASLINIRQGEICVWFRLNDTNADTVSAFLQPHREQIDREFETAPTWRPGGGRSHVIESRCGADIRDRATWPLSMAWLRTQLETFQRALWPLAGRVPPLGQRKRWDEQLFFRELREWNPACVASAHAVLRWARDGGDEVRWGSGGQAGSFTPTIVRRGVPCRLVSVRTDGTLRFQFSRLKDSPVGATRAQRLDVLAEVNRLPYVRLAEETLDQRPAVPLAMLADPAAAARFAHLLEWFRDTVKTG
jgi:hypothetical protein